MREKSGNKQETLEVEVTCFIDEVFSNCLAKIPIFCNNEDCLEDLGL